MASSPVWPDAGPPPEAPPLRALPSAQPPDAALVARSVEEPELFAALFDRHAGEVHRYLGRRVGELADDLLSDTFLVAFRRRADYRPERLDVRPLADRHRHRPGARARPGRASPLPGTGRACAEAPTRGDDPGESVDRWTVQAFRGPLAAALAALHVRDRDVLLLFAWGQLGYEEIAAVLDIPTGTVRSRLNKARHQTRAVLGPHFPSTTPPERTDERPPTAPGGRSRGSGAHHRHPGGRPRHAPRRDRGAPDGAPSSLAEPTIHRAGGCRSGRRCCRLDRRRADRRTGGPGPPAGSVTLVDFAMPTFPLSLDPEPTGLRPAFDGGGDGATMASYHDAAHREGFTVHVTADEPERLEPAPDERVGAVREVEVAGRDAELVRGSRPWCTGPDTDPDCARRGYTELVWERREGQWVRIEGHGTYDEPAQVVAVAESLVDRPQPATLDIGLAPAGWSVQDFTMDRVLSLVNDAHEQQTLIVHIPLPEEVIPADRVRESIMGPVGSQLDVTVDGRPGCSRTDHGGGRRGWFLQAQFADGTTFACRRPTPSRRNRCSPW